MFVGSYRHIAAAPTKLLKEPWRYGAFALSQPLGEHIIMRNFTASPFGHSSYTPRPFCFFGGADWKGSRLVYDTLYPC